MATPPAPPSQGSPDPTAAKPTAVKPVAAVPTARVAGGARAAVPPPAGPVDPATMAAAAQGGVPVDADGYPIEPEMHVAPGFFNQPWVQNVLPLTTSLFLHIGIIGIGLLLYTAVSKVVNPNKEQVIIPQTTSLAKSATPGGVKHPGPPADPTRDAMQDQTKDTDNQGFAADAANKLAATGGPGDSASSGFLGATAGGGHGKTFGNGTAGGGTAPWGMPGGGEGMLPKSDFMGTGGNANDIVFLCDASGSMVSVFGQLKQELKKSISEMTVDADSAQRFNVIFFQDDKASPLFPNGMQIATPENKQKASDFIDNQYSVGGTQPIPAIKMALGNHPQLLYVLTDGFDQIADMNTVIDAFKQGDADGKIHINCIFLQSDEDPKLVDALKEIVNIGHGDPLKIILKKDM